MATMQQMQKGFTRFVDNHLAAAFSGWQKAVVLGGAALIGASLPKIIESYADRPLVSAVGIIDKSSGSVDVDALYNAFIPNLGTEKIPIAIPIIGVIKLGREEFDNILRYIKEA